ncbi:putative endonuclease lcl3 [Knufia obscura]|uniref:Probable endonuclease LCL3 n=1 Tax=Knufia obscura TaxID=1635080 RepID=A0ABR0RJH7_9EURO|nr:putative endonuclease lcl3 [Knufia obscura]
MPWPKFWSSSATDTTNNSHSPTDAVTQQAADLKSKAQQTASNLRHEASHSDTFTSLTTSKPSFLTALTQPTTILATTVLTTTIISLFTLQRRFLRRFPTATDIPSTYILPSQRRFTRSLFGHVSSIGDADNFRLFHTPLGRLAFWGLLRKIPDDAKSLRNNTIHIRLAGVDAPELSHFGRPAQPYSRDAMDWLTKYLRGRRVRCYVHKADQYGRVVATVYVRKGILRRDVGLQMLRAGLAGMYEAKSGTEFGGEGFEEKYRAAEEWARKKRVGMWSDKKTLETPREYKNRFREGGGGGEGKG